MPCVDWLSGGDERSGAEVFAQEWGVPLGCRPPGHLPPILRGGGRAGLLSQRPLSQTLGWCFEKPPVFQYPRLDGCWLLARARTAREERERD